MTWRAIDELPGVAATPQRIDEWLSFARAGDEFVYASRIGSLCARGAGMRHMYALAQAGFVHVAQRSIGPDARNYVAQRTAKALAPLKCEQPAMPRDAVLAVLTRFARRGRPCPTDRRIAALAQLSCPAVAGALRELQDLKIIAIEGVRPPTLRRVRILASGETTGLVV